MELGIIQGRLLSPVEGEIQEFPKDEWEKEFDLIKETGLSHIEWIITNKSFNDGVLDLDVREYSNKISSVTCDNLINEGIFHSTFLMNQLKPICDWVISNNIKAISIPLLEESTITESNKENFYELIKWYGKTYSEIDFYFEMESDWGIPLELVKVSPNFFLIYDTGNITSCGFDHNEWIKHCHTFIKNVHLKDRTINPLKTVRPFTGIQILI